MTPLTQAASTLTREQIEGLLRGATALEWKPRGDTFPDDWRAPTQVGNYHVGVVRGGFTAILRRIGSHQSEDVVLARGEDERGVKAACEADYVERIRSIIPDLPALAATALSALAEVEALRAERVSTIPTRERLPEKPGLRSYEHVRCLIFVRGEWEVGMWNCEHLCWDDDEGDDFRYDPTEPTHWQPLPEPPARAALSSPEDRKDG